MSAKRRPTLARVHAWVGVTLALPLLLIVATGTALLFKDTLFVPADWRFTPGSTADSRSSDAEVARLISLPALQAADSVQVARGSRAFHVVEAASGDLAYWRVGRSQAEASVPLRLRVERVLIDLHEHLASGATGDTVVRVLGPIAVASMLVGLVLWWPLRAGWRARDLVPRGGGRPQWLRLHLALGGAAGALFLMNVTTGTLMAHNPTVRAWLKPLASAAATLTLADAQQAFAPDDGQAALAALRTVFPGGEITQLEPARGAAGTSWSMKLRLPGEDHPNGRSNITLDPAAGRILSARDARLAGVPGAYDDTLYPLHIGLLFGPVHRWFWLLSGTGLCLLLTAGLVSFWRHRMSASRTRRPIEASAP